MRHVLATAAAAALGLACVAGGDHIAAGPGPDDQMIGLVQAIEIAQAKVPTGVPIRAELEVEDDDDNEAPAYEVQLWVADTRQLMEVEVHAYSGIVLEVEVENGDDDDDDD